MLFRVKSPGGVKWSIGDCVGCRGGRVLRAPRTPTATLRHVQDVAYVEARGSLTGGFHPIQEPDKKRRNLLIHTLNQNTNLT